MAQLPILSWPVDLDGVSVDVTADGDTETLTFGSSETYGWGSGADTLPARFAALLTTHSKINNSSATLYVNAVGQIATYRLSYGPGTLVNITIEAAPATLRRLGLYTASTDPTDTLTFAHLTGVVSSCRWDGAFAVGASTSAVPDCEPVLVWPGQTARSPYSPGSFDRLSFGARRVWQVSYEHVEASDVQRGLDTYVDSGFATLANRQALDTHGTLSDLLVSVQSGSGVRLTTPIGGDVQTSLVADGDLSIDDVARRDGSPRRYAVALSLLETSEPTP